MSNFSSFQVEGPFGPHFSIPFNEVDSLDIIDSKSFKNRLSLLFKMMQEINHVENEDELFQLAMKYVCQILEVHRASIAIINEAGDEITFTALYGVAADHPKNIVIKAEGTAIGSSYTLDSIAYRPNLNTSTCTIVSNLFNAGMNSTLTIPIVSGSVKMGTLNSASSIPNGYNNDDMHLVQQIAGILATHLHKICLTKKSQEQQKLLETKNAELESIAYLDPLTQIYNRRFMNNIIEEEIIQNKRSPQVWSLMMIDIDFFKSINDEYGHEYGDAVLCETANFIKENIRESDTFARWGGEEFLIVLPQTNVEEAFVLTEKIRKGLDESNSKYLQTITASFGLTQYQKGESQDKLIHRADQALYLSKENGRNTTSVL